MFVATHSNLFDLDPGGYYDVRFDAHAGTVVKRESDWATVDRDHLWEPGPGRHALMDVLRHSVPDTVVFRDRGGAPLTAAEMLASLQRDDDVAVSFLEDVHGAAVRAVRSAAHAANPKSKAS